MFATSLRRGLAAGLIAGILAGLFALLVGEPALEDAIRLEEASTTHTVESSHADHGGGDVVAAAASEETGVVVSRPAQRLGLLGATALVGLTLGGLFGLGFAAVRPRMAIHNAWLASLAFGVVTWLAVALLPSLKYPANPPGVGRPETVGWRTGWYLAAIGLSVLTALGVWALSRRLRERGYAMVERHLLAGVVAAVGVAAVLIGLPSGSDPITVPAVLLWDFRLASMGTLATLWLSLAVAFGLLAERAARRSR